MAEYIDIDAQVVVTDTRGCEHETTVRHIFEMNKGVYTATDVRPVVKARWIGYPECLKYTNAYSDDHIVCSACEECFSILDNDCERFNYCPNCGAKMED